MNCPILLDSGTCCNLSGRFGLQLTEQGLHRNQQSSAPGPLLKETVLLSSLPQGC